MTPTWRKTLHLQLLEERATPAVYTVTTIADTGVGSFRWAIEQSNKSNNVHDTIDFQIGAGVRWRSRSKDFCCALVPKGKEVAPTRWNFTNNCVDARVFVVTLGLLHRELRDVARTSAPRRDLN